MRQSVGHSIGTISTGNGGGLCVSGEAFGSPTSPIPGSMMSHSVSESESGSSLFHSSSEILSEKLKGQPNSSSLYNTTQHRFGYNMVMLWLQNLVAMVFTCTFVFV